jgi:hypothetical protein
VREGYGIGPDPGKGEHMHSTDTGEMVMMRLEIEVYDQDNRQLSLRGVYHHPVDNTLIVQVDTRVLGPWEPYCVEDAKKAAKKGRK